MRLYAAVVGLTLLTACGGDSDITTPPADQSFSLTISGQGSGSGQVATAAGTTPLLDCRLVTGEQPAGTCSATYPESSIVNLTATPDSGASFTGWNGDAASCTTEPSCPITMTANRTAGVEFSAAPVVADTGVQITTSNWYVDPGTDDDGGVVWLAEVKNNTPQVAELVEVDFTSYDPAGNVLATDFVFLGPIPPGETRANESFATLVGTEARTDIQVGQVEFSDNDLGLSAAQVVSSNWRIDPEYADEGAVIWTVEVQNTSHKKLESVQVDFITYDANGQILDYDLTFVGPLAPGARKSSKGFAQLRGGEANVKFEIAGVIGSD
jgi:hypothetical protein